MVMALNISNNQPTKCNETNNVFEDQRQKLSDYTVRINEALQRAFRLAGANIDKVNQNPLYEKGIKVYSDDFIGPMPIYGVRESEYILIKNTIEDIANDRGKIRIAESSSPEFREAVLLDVFYLMSRPVGRELILRISESEDVVTIQEAATFAETRFCRETQTVYLYQEEMQIFTAMVVHAKFMAPAPRATTFGHELVHFLHWVLYTKKTGVRLCKIDPTLSKRYRNLSEQYAITGIGNDRFAMLHIHENAIRQEHGIPTRFSHEATVFSEKILSDHTDPIARLKLAIEDGAVDNVLHYLRTAEAAMIHQNYPFIFQDVMRNELLTTQEKEAIIYLLIESGMPVLSIIRGSTLLHTAALHTNSVKICQWLVNAGVNPNLKDSDGDTPLKLAKLRKKEEMIQFFEKYSNSACVIS